MEIVKEHQAIKHKPFRNVYIFYLTLKLDQLFPTGDVEIGSKVLPFIELNFFGLLSRGAAKRKKKG